MRLLPRVWPIDYFGPDRTETYDSNAVLILELSPKALVVKNVDSAAGNKISFVSLVMPRIFTVLVYFTA
jgi:hypothetical protein